MARERYYDDVAEFTYSFGTESRHGHVGERIRHLAHHDDLTGLPNRLILGDRLDEAITRAKPADTTLAFLFLDLNKFKPINDEYGHAVGGGYFGQWFKNIPSDRLFVNFRELFYVPN